MEPQNVTDTPVADLTVHPENPRQGDLPSIIQSIEANGWYGTLVAQKSTGFVLAGNHRLMAAKALNMETVPTYWVDVDDATARRIMLADNRTAELATYNDDQLINLLTKQAEADDLAGTGYEPNDVQDLVTLLGSGGGGVDLPDSDTDHSSFTREVKSPVYTATGDCPEVADLFDRTYCEELLADIDAAEDLPPDIRNFLRSAAERHTTFRFDRIAEFYCHADARTQDLFERSALVIIDFDKAVEYGFVEMRERFANLYSAEYGTDE